MTLQKKLLWLKSVAAKLPASDGVSEVFALIDTGMPYTELFFGHVSDPAWLVHLERKGYFADTGGETASGRTDNRTRLSLFALARFAVTVPSAVANILLRMPRAATVARADDVLRCLAAVKDRQAIASLRPLAIALAESTRNSASVWIEEILKAWIAAGAQIEAASVLRAFIGATVRSPSEEQTRLGSHWQFSEIDAKLVSRMAKERPHDIAVMYFEALSRWAAIRRADSGAHFRLDDSDPARDAPPVYWLEDFKKPSRDSRDLEGTLATRLFVTCEQIFATGDAREIGYLDLLLRADRWELFNRLRWQLYADYPQFTAPMARRDVLEILSDLGRLDCVHHYEFAQMLTNHAATHKYGFLTVEEVERFAKAVLAGPLDRAGCKITDYEPKHFWQRQLQPIEPLLTEAMLKHLDSSARSLDSYKPVQSMGARSIEQVSPVDAAALGEMPDDELWAFLNTWKPARREGQEWWIEQSIDALAGEFATVIEKNPSRFQAKDQWWKKISRPVILQRHLERAVSQLSAENYKVNPPADSQWENWLGIAEWILAQPSPASENGGDWPTVTAARFLKASVQSGGGGSADRFTKIKGLLQVLVDADDPRLERAAPSMGDWLTTAINSTRGDALEAVLDIALRQNQAKAPIDDWIFAALRRRLETPDESPAVFALLGARLRLLVYLFPGFKSQPELLFPPSRPEHRDAAVLAHYQYDNPASQVRSAFPNLLGLGLDRLESAVREKKEDDKLDREFAVRLGMHTAFYYWHDGTKVPSMDALDRFFRIARSQSRASVIGQIGSAFDNGNPDQIPIDVRERAMAIWDHRFEQMVGGARDESLVEFQAELAAFLEWMRCECFPFEWRVRRVISALNLLTAGPRPYRLVKFLSQQSTTADRLLDTLKVLEALVRKTNDEVRWSIQDKELRPLLESAFKSADASVRLQAEATLEILLRQGFLGFLDVGLASGVTVDSSESQ